MIEGKIRRVRPYKQNFCGRQTAATCAGAGAGKADSKVCDLENIAHEDHVRRHESSPD